MCHQPSILCFLGTRYCWTLQIPNYEPGLVLFLRQCSPFCISCIPRKHRDCQSGLAAVLDLILLTVSSQANILRNLRESQSLTLQDGWMAALEHMHTDEESQKSRLLARWAA